MRKITAVFLFVLLCVVGMPGSIGAETAAGTSRARLLLLDLFLPGYGSYYYEKYVTGTMIVTGRVLTLYLAGIAWKEAREYRSAARAARNADLYFGPGFRYKDPYGSGFYTADEFRRRADRRALSLGLALTAHIVITVFSLFSVADSHERERMEHLPVFEIRSESAAMQSTADRNTGNGVRLSITAIRRDF